MHVGVCVCIYCNFSFDISRVISSYMDPVYIETPYIYVRVCDRVCTYSKSKVHMHPAQIDLNSVFQNIWYLDRRD